MSSNKLTEVQLKRRRLQGLQEERWWCCKEASVGHVSYDTGSAASTVLGLPYLSGSMMKWLLWYGSTSLSDNLAGIIQPSWKTTKLRFPQICFRPLTELIEWVTWFYPFDYQLDSHSFNSHFWEITLWYHCVDAKWWTVSEYTELLNYNYTKGYGSEEFLSCK